MNTTSGGGMLNTFPIDGKLVCDLLARALMPEEICEVVEIETLCTENCAELGALWHRVVASRAERVTVGELLRILVNADQVVSLDLRCVNNRERELLIEDGELVENKLSTPVRRT